jgi:hypothetical protein
MFASVVAARILASVLTGVPEVIALTGARLLYDMVVPADIALPAGLFYFENPQYTTPIGNGALPTGQTLRGVVRMIDDGESFLPLEDAAYAQFEALHGKRFDLEHRGHMWLVTVDAMQEYPLPTVTVRDQPYRQLGTIYSVNVTRGA